MFRNLFRTGLVFLIFSQLNICLAQQSYQISLNTSNFICQRGEAALGITGTGPNDTISIYWSNGATDVKKIYDLTEGNYSVNIKIKHTDTIAHLTDTTFSFFIEKEVCGVSFDKYFSPNDDNYHDKMGISNVEQHPNFELTIFNKWGQQVHTQRREYTPWDGTWNGINLPDGTYYYVFFYNADEKTNPVKGDVTILR